MEGHQGPTARVHASEEARAALEGKVTAAVAVWTGELVDLGGRNTLLYYRDLKQGTLDLTTPGPRRMTSQWTRCSAAARPPFGVCSTPRTWPAAARRARTVKAKADGELRGAGHAHPVPRVGDGELGQPTTTATPAAPMLLREAALGARGGAGEDFDVSLPGEWEINPTLLHLLKADHRVQVDGRACLPASTRMRSRRTRAGFRPVGEGRRGCARVRRAPRVVIGNFSYAKLPMVLDLENVRRDARRSRT